MERTIFLIFPNQLFDDITALKKYNAVIMVEDPLFFYDARLRPVKPNKIKIAYMRACMKFHHDILKSKGVPVSYIDYDNAKRNHSYGLTSNDRITCYDPTDHALSKKLTSIFSNITFIHSPNFLLSISNLEEYRNQHKTPRHASFYEFAKKTVGVLAGVKSQDKLNRLPPPDNVDASRIAERYDNGVYAPYYKEAIHYATTTFKSHVGDALELGLYPISSKDAYSSLAVFLKERFANYGPYQDAIYDREPFMYHTVISPMLNIGLLDPKKVLSMILAYKDKVPLNSLEGLVRQLIGWREYMRYIYLFYYNTISKANLPDNNMYFKDAASWYTGKTGVYPLDMEIQKAVKYGYAHHIIRLMVFMNFFVLCEIRPEIIYKWFMEVVAIDAYDWVMISNIYAMGYFDKGAMRKPYITTSNYVLKMSNYKRDGYWDELWTALFYRFVSKKPATYVGFYKRLLKNKKSNAKYDIAETFLASYTART